MIASHLEYPDLLSLKISHPHFQTLFATQPTVHQRIAWVLARGRIFLPTPHDSQTNFRTDAQFLRNPEVTRIIRRRRQHLECVENNLTRRIVWLRNQSQGLPTHPQLCLVKEGYECARLRELREKTTQSEKKLGRRLLRRMGWSNAFWESGSVYWEVEPIHPPHWFVALKSWPASVNAAPRFSLFSPTLYLDLSVLALALAVAGLLVLGSYGYTIGAMLKSMSNSLCRWFEAMLEDWAHELHLPP